MKISEQLAGCVVLLDWLTECYQSVRGCWVRTPYGAFAEEPLRIETDSWRGVESKDAPRQLPLALRLKNGRVYVGSKTVRNHADLWDELQASRQIEVGEIVDLGFWSKGAYCPSKPRVTPSK